MVLLYRFTCECKDSVNPVIEYLNSQQYLYIGFILRSLTFAEVREMVKPPSAKHEGVKYFEGLCECYRPRKHEFTLLLHKMTTLQQ